MVVLTAAVLCGTPIHCPSASASSPRVYFSNHPRT